MKNFFINKRSRNFFGQIKVPTKYHKYWSREYNVLLYSEKDPLIFVKYFVKINEVYKVISLGMKLYSV